MAEAVTKLPVKTDKQMSAATTSREWEPFDALRQQIDRLFDDFQRGWGMWLRPFGGPLTDVEPAWKTFMSWGAAPAVDILEREKDYELTAELPGMDPGNVEVTYADGLLTIKGEKKEEKEEKKKGYHLSERRYGAIQRSLRVPSGVDADRFDANFKNGVLTVTMPKVQEAQRQEKKIAVKAR